MVEKWILFIKGHERLLLVLMIVGGALLGWHKWVAHADQADHDASVVAAARLKADTQAAQAANAQVAQLQSTVNQQAQQIAQLSQAVTLAIAQRNTQTTQRKEAEASESLPLVTQRWSELAKTPPGGLTQMGAGVLATDAAARSTVQALEDGSTAAANLADFTRLDLAKDEQIKGLNTLVDSMKKASQDAQVLLKDQVDSCKADLKVANDNGKKAGRKGFWRGLGVGAAAVGAVVLRFL